MNALSRRQFLLASGVTAAAALTTAGTRVGWPDLMRRAAHDPLPTGSGVLVLCTLYGGNDGLDTVIPYADAAYHDARPRWAYAESDVVKLDASVGLHPALKGLGGLWADRQLAIVRGVGYPRPDRSHFRSMDIWQTASPDAPTDTGWIGRWLDTQAPDPLRAVSLGAVLPPLAVGARCAAATLPLGPAGAASPLPTAGVQLLAGPDPTDSPTTALIRSAMRDQRLVAATLDPVRAATPAPGSAGHSDGGALAAQLDLVARCITAGVPTQVYAVSLGGFDSHAEEKSTHSAVLGTLDRAVSGFLSAMAQHPRGAGVTLMVYSEFGRRVRANASLGTDHGTAGPVLLAGVPVRGGFYGEEPSLTDLTDGDLKAGVDFRAVYGEVLHRVLGADPARILGAERPELGFLP